MSQARAHGFTLVELMVALGIAAVLLATVPFAAARAHDAITYQSTVRHIVAGLRVARLEAMRSGQPTVFAVDLEARRFGVLPELRHSTPAHLVIGLELADREWDGSIAGIRFYPDGGASGGSITLVRTSGGGTRITVDWLLGRIDHQPLPGIVS